MLVGYYYINPKKAFDYVLLKDNDNFESKNDKKLLSWDREAKKPRLCTVTKLFTTYGVFRLTLPVYI